ncbi:MAG: hypothetical protein AAGJ85_09665, partial [Pseudomonadota bacterium]
MKRFAETMVRENIGEQLATAGQDFAAWQYLNPEKTLDDYLAERPDAALQTAIATTIVTGQMSGAVFALEEAGSAIDQRVRRASMTEGEQAVDKLMDKAGESKLRKRSPEAFSGAVEAMVERSDAETMLLDLDGLQQSLGEDGDVIGLLEAVGIDRETAEQAYQEGGEIEVRTSELLTSEALDQFREVIQQNVKLSADYLTPLQRQAELEKIETDFEQEISVLAEEAQAEALNADEGLQVREQIESALAESYAPEAIGPQADVMTALNATLANDLGVTQTEAWSDYGPVIQQVFAGDVTGQSSPDIVNAALEQGYEGQDRGEAAEWLSAKAKGLDMSTEGRMARAKEMGFDTETVLYHGTPDGGFEEFRPDQFFAEDPSYANRFTSAESASSSYYGATGDAPAVYSLLVKGEAFDTRIPEHRKILEKEFAGKYGEGTLTEKGLPDWVEGRDMAEFLREAGLDRRFSRLI